MKNKILVNVFVPMIEEEYDIYIPTVKRVGTIKNLIVNLVAEQSENAFVNDGCKCLYDKITGEKIEEQQFVKDSNLKNGSKLILY